jgi:outer membrane receptor protein involved in Fe transport
MGMRRISRLGRALAAGVALAALSVGLVSAQQSQISIPAQTLSETLKDISRQTGGNILFTPESVSGIQAPALSGKMNPQQALTRLLAGTRLEAVPDGSGGYIVRSIAQKKSLAGNVQTQDIETVTVTGSRFLQTGVTSASPIVVVGQTELKYEGTTDVATLINQLPSAFAAQNSNVSNGATGTSNINLRDLGPSRTLVLIDSSRLMPGDPQDVAADINVIPAALVDHVEVLTGGASAVYGSDALAGVVNFILRKDFDGIEVDGTYSSTQNDNDTGRWRDLTQEQINQGGLGYAQAPNGVWNGETEDANLLVGVNSDDGKGNVSVYLGYRSVAAVLQQSREYSECALQPAPGISQGDVCEGSTNFNHWLSFDNAFAGAPYNYFETGSGKPNSGAFVPFTSAPDQTFNFNPTNYFQRPDTRYTGGFFAHYDESKRLQLYANFMFADDDTVAQIAPSGLFFGSGTQPDFTNYVNCSNPLMTPLENRALCGLLPGDKEITIGGRTFWNGAGNAPADSGNPFGAAGQADLLIARRDFEGGNRQFALRHTAYRMQIGVRGDLLPDWTYNVYAQEGFTQFAQTTSGEFSVSRVQNALQVDPLTGKCYAAENGTAPGCVPLDIFNGIGSITPAMLDYVNATAQQTGWTEEKIVSGSTTGDLGGWGAQSPFAHQSATVVLGAEYRQENLNFEPDYEYRSGDIEGSPPIPAIPAAELNVSEGFGEFELPLVQDRPLVEDATLKSGYRYSSYNAAGATRAWYVAADWQPIDDVRYRASMQRAVRAPNVIELFTPQITLGFSSTYPETDPCATITTGECAMVPNHGTELLNCPAFTCSDQMGGNVLLSPETSTTRTLGIILTPGFLDGFTATVDWWDINVSNYISILPIQEILDFCYGAPATKNSEAYFCPFVHRTPSGMLYGNGYVSDDSINTGYLKTKGIDFEVNYQTDTADWWGLNQGTLTLNLVGTYLDWLINEPVPSSPLTAQSASQSAYNCAGFYGFICGTPAPRWRHKLRLTWSTPWDAQISLQWRFIGAVRFDADTTDPLLGGGPGIVPCPNSSINVAGFQDCPDAHISSYSYFDLSGAWQVRSGVELRAGVNNVFDIEPPILTAFAATPFSNGNTITGLYDVLGRTIFVAATAKY